MALSKKHRAFVEQYLATFNATEAYDRVYSPKNRVVSASNGYRLLRNAQIEQAVKERLAETAMSADEVLMRLGRQARGTMADFIDIPADGEPGIDLAKAQEADRLDLLKELIVEERTYGEMTVRRVSIKLHDAQAALVHLGRHHKLFTDKQEVEHSLDVDDPRDELLSRIGRLATRSGAESGDSGDDAG